MPDETQTDGLTDTLAPSRPSGLGATLTGESPQVPDSVPKTTPTTVDMDGGSAASDNPPPATPPPALVYPDPIVLSSMQEASIFFADNLVSLHKAVSVFAPIVSVAGIGIDMSSYTVAFDSIATDEQKNAAYAFMQNWPMYSGKAHIADFNRQELERWFSEQLEAGCELSNGYSLGLTPNDVALLTGNYVLAQTAANIGLPLPDLIDKDGVPHRIESLAVLTQLMLEYGQYRAGLSAVYAAKKAAIEQAIAELNANS